MVRRRSPPPKPMELAEGWTAHEGGPCPLDPDSMPAIVFRGGTRVQPGKRKASSWGNMWEHDGSTMDIVGYQLS